MIFAVWYRRREGQRVNGLAKYQLMSLTDCNGSDISYSETSHMWSVLTVQSSSSQTPLKGVCEHVSFMSGCTFQLPARGKQKDSTAIASERTHSIEKMSNSILSGSHFSNKITCSNCTNRFKICLIGIHFLLCLPAWV